MDLLKKVPEKPPEGDLFQLMNKVMRGEVRLWHVPTGKPVGQAMHFPTDLYDRARPGYPVPVFEALATFGDLRPGSRVLELGPGTGQATRPLAERGYQVVAVELGARLAERARRNLAHFPTVTLVNAAVATFWR